MGIFKAIGKLGAKTVSRKITKIQAVNAPSRAYKQTGKELAKARKRGEWIDGSSRYRQNRDTAVQNAYRSGNDRDTFINDL